VSDALLAVVFVLAAAVSLTTSWLLVSRLERIGARLGLSEALLGMLAALAADAPEITASVTALAGHHSRIGAGVVIGSNVFNLAALLGLSAVVAGEIRLHPRVIILEGTVAMLIATVCLSVVLGGAGPGLGLLVAVAVLVPYLLVSGFSPQRLGTFGLPQAWVRWLSEAVAEEEQELEPAIHPPRARGLDMVLAVLATTVVVGASIAMADGIDARRPAPHRGDCDRRRGSRRRDRPPQRGLRAVSRRSRKGCSDAQHRFEQQRTERHRRSVAPGASRSARRAVGTGDTCRSLVPRPDRRDVGVCVRWSRASANSRRIDHLRVPRVRCRRSHNELTVPAPSRFHAPPGKRHQLLARVSESRASPPGSSAEGPTRCPRRL
jgi:hypothetical protein